MDHVVELEDALTFHRCRRAWDLGAGTRQNLEPREQLRPFDLGVALRAGLAAWYFPAMWAWQRSLVRPIALDSFATSMHRQRGDAADPAAFPEGEWAEALARGREILEEYLDWAPTVDDFTTVRVGAGFDVVVPDPDQAGAGLVAAGGGGVRLKGGMDLLVSDEHHRLWLVEHRMVERAWPDRDTLALGYRAGVACWAVERQYDARVGGVFFNELRLGPGPGNRFRRTRVRKTPTELRRLRQQFARVAGEMTDPALPVYPDPSPEHCAGCAFVAPCLAMGAGEDATAILAERYRARVPEEIPLPPRTGSPGPQRVYGWKTKGPGVKQPY